MTLKKAFLGLATAGLLTLGGTGAAFAATGSPTTPPNGTSPPAHQRCQNASQRIDHLQTFHGRVETRITKLRQALSQAEAQHNDALVKKLEARLSRAQRIAGAITKRIQRIATVCHVTAPATSSPTATTPATTQAA